jgi:hypothetical protein
VSPPSSGSKNKPSKKPAWIQVASIVLVSCSAHFSTLKMEAISEMSVDFQRTTRRYIPEDRNLHNHRCENIKYYIPMFVSLLVPTSWRTLLQTSVNDKVYSVRCVPAFRQNVLTSFSVIYSLLTKNSAPWRQILFVLCTVWMKRTHMGKTMSIWLHF